MFALRVFIAHPSKIVLDERFHSSIGHLHVGHHANRLAIPVEPQADAHPLLMGTNRRKVDLLLQSLIIFLSRFVTFSISGDLFGDKIGKQVANQRRKGSDRG